MFGEWQHRRVGGVPPPTATSLMLSMSICLPQRLLDTDFSTELTSQKQSTDELCEVLILVHHYSQQGEYVVADCNRVVSIWWHREYHYGNLHRFYDNS